MTTENKNLLKVSVLIPCLNEETHIAACLDSLLDCSLEGADWEIFVLDGLSDDATRSIVSDYQQRYPFIRLIDNPQKLKPIALNIGVRLSRGRVIMRIDAHSTYSTGYVDALLHASDSTGAENVGGVQVASAMPNSREGFWARAIRIAVSHPLAMGDAIHRFDGADEIREVNTVFCGCYRREVFDQIGLFNEKLVRAQDREFNERLLEAGGRILLIPGVKAYYRPRTRLLAHLSWIFEGSKWLFRAGCFTETRMIRGRNLVPALFLAYLVFLAIPFSLFNSPAVIFLVSSPLLIYLSALFSEGARQAVRSRSVAAVFAFPALVFFTHVTYALGTFRGLAYRLG